MCMHVWQNVILMKIESCDNFYITKKLIEASNKVDLPPTVISLKDKQTG